MQSTKNMRSSPQQTRRNLRGPSELRVAGNPVIRSNIANSCRPEALAQARGPGGPTGFSQHVSSFMLHGEGSLLAGRGVNWKASIISLLSLWRKIIDIILSSLTPYSNRFDILSNQVHYMFVTHRTFFRATAAANIRCIESWVLVLDRHDNMDPVVCYSDEFYDNGHCWESGIIKDERMVLEAMTNPFSD